MRDRALGVAQLVRQRCDAHRPWSTARRRTSPTTMPPRYPAARQAAVRVSRAARQVAVGGAPGGRGMLHRSSDTTLATRRAARLRQRRQVSAYDLRCRCAYDLMCRSVFGESWLANNLLRSVMPTFDAVLLTHQGKRGPTKNMNQPAEVRSTALPSRVLHGGELTIWSSSVRAHPAPQIPNRLSCR